MNPKSLRRLAGDHGSLHTAGLPPNYLFPPSADSSADLTSLDVLLAGPIGTPYAGGVWKLHLDIPATYPTAPPTAQFRTRLWHPNIDEATGAVCVETLKRDWSSTLKLRDVLVTISCLLIQPNPASALNEAAGKLAFEDWDTYCRRAKLMTEIHAAVPSSMAEAVQEAQMRGEDRLAAPEVSRPQVKGKGKECVKLVPVSSKSQRLAEDEENTRRRGETQELDSDPESDWIPGPHQTSKAPSMKRDNDIFGIKGLDGTIKPATPPKRVLDPDDLITTSNAQDTQNDSDPFVTITSKRSTHTSHSCDLRLPFAFIPNTLSNHSSAADTPELLKFSHQNPFSAIQPNNQSHPLLREFSYTWEESQIVYETGVINVGQSRSEVKKRMADDDFERKKKSELKRFKRAGFDLGRYNRGDFGPRTGVSRL